MKTIHMRCLLLALALAGLIGFAEAGEINPNPELDARVTAFLESHRSRWRDMNVPLADGKRGAISRTSVVVPRPSPPRPPSGLEALPGPGKVRLTWKWAEDPDIRFTVYRAEQGSDDFRCLNADSPTRANALVVKRASEHSSGVRGEGCPSRARAVIS